MTRKLRMAVAVLVPMGAGALLVALGWHAVGGLLIFVALAAAVAYLLIVARPARIAPDSLLRTRLSGTLREHAATPLLERLRGGQAPTLHQLREALQEAVGDPRVSAVMIEIAGLHCGLASAQELHDLIGALTAAGKRTVAVLEGDSLSAREYLIAAAAGEIIANPDTTLAMVGLSAGGLFFKDALQRLQIDAQALQWKEYKGAAESFSRQDMSAPLRQSIAEVLGDSERLMVEYVARARHLSAPAARAMLTRGFVGAQAACADKLIDRIGYSQEMLSNHGPNDKRVVGLTRYLRRVRWRKDRGKLPRIGLVFGVGPVLTGDEPLSGEFISAVRTSAELLRAGRDERVKAVVFRVNSPGGAAVGSDLVWRAVKEVRGLGKPVVVSMGDVAGSGGYYVAAGADAIVAQSATITGSIGVVYVKFSIGALLRKLGVAADLVKMAPNGDAMSFTRALDHDELQQLDQVMGELYGNFTAKVAEGRHLSAEQTEAVAKGRIWSGSAALGNGLVDALGGLERAIAIAREKAGLPPGQALEVTIIGGGLGGLKAALMPNASGAADGWPRWLAGLTGVPEAWLPALGMLCQGMALLSPWLLY